MRVLWVLCLTGCTFQLGQIIPGGPEDNPTDLALTDPDLSGLDLSSSDLSVGDRSMNDLRMGDLSINDLATDDLPLDLSTLDLTTDDLPMDLSTNDIATPTKDLSSTDMTFFPAGQWRISNRKPAPNDLIAGCGDSKISVHVVGENGIILYSIDRGANWTQQVNPTRSTLRGCTATGQFHIVVGDDGTILRTINNVDWAVIANTDTHRLNAVYAATNSNVVAVGDSGTILVSTDGGLTFTKQVSGTTQHLLAVASPGTNYFAAGGGATLLKAIPAAGSNPVWSWAPVTVTGTTSAITGLMTRSNNIISITGAGTLLNTSNGGTSWTTPTGGPDASTTLNAIDFRSTTVLTVGTRLGTQVYLRSTDSGANFMPMQGLPSVVGTYRSTFFVTGDTYLLQSGGGISWSANTDDPDPTMVVWLERSSGPTTFSLLNGWASGADDVYAVGVGGSVWRSTDQGGTWVTKPYPNPSANVLAIWGTDKNNIYVDQTDLVFRTQDQGGTWSNISGNLPASPGLTGLWATGSDLYAAGAGGVVYHTNNGGGQWIAETSTDANTSDQLNGVWGTSTSNVYAVGGNGLILHFDGTSWNKQPSGGTANFVTLRGAGPNEIYAVGGPNTGGVIAYFDGSSWTPRTIPTDSTSVGGVWVRGAQVFFTTLSGNIFSSLDHGANFTSTADALHSPLLLGMFGAGTDLYAAGFHGAILRYSP